MNFLAHLHLSYPNTNEMVGNFIGDYVKGKQYHRFTEEIAKGVILHRKIDFFTDRHELPKECRALFRGAYGLYSGIIVDMLFDHLLAKNWNNYCEVELLPFTHLCYDELALRNDLLPERVQFFLPKMRSYNRLYSYVNIEDMEHAIKQMSIYTSLPDKTEEAIRIFEENGLFIEEKFSLFYKELMAYVNTIRPELDDLI